MQMLFWLEVLGVSKFIREAYWALTCTERWLQVMLFMGNVGLHPTNKFTGKKGG